MNRRDALCTLTGLAGATLLALPASQALAQSTMVVSGAKLTMPQYKMYTLLGGTFAKQTSQWR